MSLDFLGPDHEREVRLDAQTAKILVGRSDLRGQMLDGRLLAENDVLVLNQAAVGDAECDDEILVGKNDRPGFQLENACVLIIFFNHYK